MPNWCFSDVEIISSKENIDILEGHFKKALSSNPLEADFGNNWLGNLLYYIGLPEEQVIHGSPRCRGSILYFNRDTDNDETIRLQTESAWSPHLQCIKMFVDHFVNEDDVDIFYTAEESGCGLYYTNDLYFDGRVYVDYAEYSDDFPTELARLLDHCCDAEEKYVVEALSKYLGHEGTLYELAEEINDQLEETDAGYVSLNIYEYVELSDLE